MLVEIVDLQQEVEPVEKCKVSLFFIRSTNNWICQSRGVPLVFGMVLLMGCRDFSKAHSVVPYHSPYSTIRR